MTAIEFVEKINSTQLSSDELKGIGGEGFADTIIRRGTIVKLQNDFIEYGNEVLNLVLNYNVSLFEVINIKFDEDLYDVGDDIFFGWDINGDRLGFNKYTKEIFAYYIESDEVSSYCSPDDKTFLDVLFLLHDFQNERICTNGEDEMLFLEKVFIEKLKLFFDNEKYVGFYKIVIGYEDDDEILE
ncbi:hypothetical protein ACR79P_05110 [Sphingobacterium spiritivorum]|uniref:hypothetical protein n=1 Tax=Sphingobacterium spiritivorum TaxID=258 RepID=UPI003DA2A23A